MQAAPGTAADRSGGEISEKLATFACETQLKPDIRMTTIQLRFRPSTVEGREGTLFYRIIRNRTARPIRTSYKLLPEEWDDRAKRILPPPAGERRLYLTELQERVDRDLDRLRRIIERLEARNPGFTHEELRAAYAAPERTTLFGFMEETIARLKAQGRQRTGETYEATLRSFSRFRNGRDLHPEELTSEVTTAYEAWLKASGVCKNTSSFYMRILRALYNRAAEQGLTPQRQPFRHVYTGIDKTAKRALPLEALRRIRDMDLSGEPRLDFARDMFLFSFYTRGMAFVDMAFLRKRNLTAGVLTYRRQKTGQQLSIGWEPCMQELVEKYSDEHSDYLLPIIGPTGDERREYRNGSLLLNRALKRVGRLAGLAVPLTLYVARHTWASVARSRNIPLSVISESMGHDSETTTRIYLASLDTAEVDRANRIVIDSLENGDIG